MIGSVAFLGAAVQAAAQERITIEQCQQWALENYPAIRQYGLLEQAEKYILSNIGRVYRPEFSLSGTASWQSEKTELEMDFPQTNVNVDLGEMLPESGLPAVDVPISVSDLKVPVSDQDRYNVALSLNQALWVGGRMKKSKEVARREMDMLRSGVDVQLYKIKDKVKQLYFGLLTLEGREQQLDRADEILDSVRMRADAALKEGLIYETDMDMLEGERIKYEQLRIELNAKRKACLNVLSSLIHRPVTEETVLEVPDVEASLQESEIKRPEMDFFDKRRKKLDADLEMVDANNMPNLGLFATGGYGKSGLNSLDSDFKPYFIGGVMFSWNFGQLNTSKNNKRLVRVQQEQVDMLRESFAFNTRMEVAMQDAEIQKLREMLEKDEEVIRIRKDILKASEVKYSNGVYTISELITDVNQLFIAEQEKALREIELQMMIYTRMITLGI